MISRYNQMHQAQLAATCRYRQYRLLLRLTVPQPHEDYFQTTKVKELKEKRAEKSERAERAEKSERAESLERAERAENLERTENKRRQPNVYVVR